LADSEYSQILKVRRSYFKLTSMDASSLAS